MLRTIALKAGDITTEAAEKRSSTGQSGVVIHFLAAQAA
jgi:hypothetical protein